MAIRSQNTVTAATVIALCLLCLTLWRAQHPAAVIPGDNTSVAAAPPVAMSLDTTKVNSEQIPMPKRPSFLEIAKEFGTDKVTDHHYNFMYEKYLEPLRDKKLKMLEIGLGCDMSYGPGASYHTWLKYFPNVDLYYVEYNADCVEKWKSKTPGATVYTGDQSNATFLEEVIVRSGGNFDVIIDDGGHYMNQQMISLETLYKAVLPGGVYFCEDLATSYDPWYEGGEGKVTMYGMIKDLLDDLNYATGNRPEPKYPFSKDIRSVECGEQICAFSKK